MIHFVNGTTPEVMGLLESKIVTALPGVKGLAIKFMVGINFHQYIQAMSFMDEIRPVGDMTIAQCSNRFFIFSGTPDDLKVKLEALSDKKTVPTPERVLIKSTFARMAKVMAFVNKIQTDFDAWNIIQTGYKPPVRLLVGQPPTDSKENFMKWIDPMTDTWETRSQTKWFSRDDVTIEIIAKAIEIVRVKEIMES